MYLQPLFDIVEGLLVGDVVDDNDTVGSPVVGRGDGPEPLLSGCVPDLGENFVRYQILLGSTGPVTWSFIVFPSSSIVLILKSTPIVEM